MKLTVKTLKGGKFEVECEPSNTVVEVKGIIESTKTDLTAANMKLIHSGKVLKDDYSIESCGIKPNDFLVVMVTKSKKFTVSKDPSGAAAAATTNTNAASTLTGSDDAKKHVSEEKKKEPEVARSSTTFSAESAARAPAPSSAADTAAPASNAADDVLVETVSSLVTIGFPEAEVRHCLRAAGGNPDVAVEFLTNGIPPGMQSGVQNVALAGSTGELQPISSSSGGTLSALRNHSQFTALRQLVQSNPAMLQSVLTQIGQQQPELLTEINANQEVFLQMMNEPIEETSTSASSSTNSESNSSSAPDVNVRGISPSLEGMTNSAQMVQMIQSMSPDELNQMAIMMGLSPEQLRTTAQLLDQIPPEQMQQYMAHAVSGGGGFPGSMGGGSAQGEPQVLSLTQEEMAAVDRLADMGFDRSEAAQAYLACDKNEALAANLLMDSMADGEYGFGGDGSGGSGDGNNNDDTNESDEMYD